MNKIRFPKILFCILIIVSPMSFLIADSGKIKDDKACSGFAISEDDYFDWYPYSHGRVHIKKLCSSSSYSMLKNRARLKGFLTIQKCLDSGDFTSCNHSSHETDTILLYMHDEQKTYILSIDKKIITNGFLDQALSRNDVLVYGRIENNIIIVDTIIYPYGRIMGKYFRTIF